MVVKKGETIPKYTPERIEGLIKSLSRGVPVPVAAPANGIGEKTFYRWVILGLNDIEDDIDSDLARLALRLKGVQQDKIIRHMDAIDSKPERWQADAWILERSFWKYFSPSAAVVDFEKRLAMLEDSKLKEELQSEIKDIKSQQNAKKQVRTTR
jgi:hypothetical protein